MNPEITMEAKSETTYEFTEVQSNFAPIDGNDDELAKCSSCSGCDGCGLGV
jgi:hypothetical protein